MFFNKHKKQAFEIMNERNRQYLEKMKAEGKTPEQPEGEDLTPEEAQRRLEEYKKENDPGLEKGDVPALILSALLVFGPIFLVLIGLMVLAWVLLH